MPAGHAFGTWTTFASETWTTGWQWRHVFVHEVGEGHELFFAQLAVAILIEFGEQFFGLRHFRRAIVATIGTVAVVVAIRTLAIVMTVWMMTIAVMPAVIIAIFLFLMTRMLITIAIVTSLTMASLHELTHFLAGFLAFVVA
jgi:hypothetical protein